MKSAGLCTHTLVGFGAALFVLISKYGFSDMLIPGYVIIALGLEPADAAAAAFGHRDFRAPGELPTGAASCCSCSRW